MLSDFEKDKVYWSGNMNLKLVNFMKTKPHMWSPKHPQYTSAKIREHTYSQFAALYDYHDYQLSGQVVKDRWTNIRSTFGSYVRKLHMAETDDKPYKVNWPLWEPCQFLLKVTKSAMDAQHATEPDDIMGTIKFEEEPDDDDTLTFDKVDSECNDKKNVSCKTIANDLANVFKGFQNDAFSLDKTRNGKIGQSVTKKLSEMDPHNSAKMSVKIMEILLKYESDTQI